MSSGNRYQKDIFQRIADKFFEGKRGTVMAIFFVTLFTVPWLTVIGLVLFGVLTNNEKSSPQASRRANPVPPPRPAQRPAPRPVQQSFQQAAPKAPAKPRPVNPRPKHTGDPAADQLLDAGYEFLCAADNYLPEIEDYEVQAKVKEACAKIKGIMNWVQTKPEAAKSAGRLSSYYLPTTQKLLKTYTTVDDAPGPNAKAICQQIARTLDTLNQALENLQNNLLDSTALDVEAEISAMEQMLGCEGLTGEFKMPEAGKEDSKQ